MPCCPEPSVLAPSGDDLFGITFSELLFMVTVITYHVALIITILKIEDCNCGDIDFSPARMMNLVHGIQGE
jgi:hypothetical protein